MRLDDACEHWNKEKWHRMHDLLNEYNIKPIIAIIPKVEDKKLLCYPTDSEYLYTIKQWIREGWTPALHGYNHVLIPSKGGLNPVNNRSEFVGLSLNKQIDKIKKGLKILENNMIEPEIFVAPAHTFDNNTLAALKEETNIRIISDTIADDIYWCDDFYYVPQQSGKVRALKSKVVTFCYHPNNVSDKQFDILNDFLKLHKHEFISFSELQFKRRKRTFYDKTLSFVYFARQKTIKRNN